MYYKYNTDDKTLQFIENQSYSPKKNVFEKALIEGYRNQHKRYIKFLEEKGYNDEELDTLSWVDAKKKALTEGYK